MQFLMNLLRPMNWGVLELCRPKCVVLNSYKSRFSIIDYRLRLTIDVNSSCSLLKLNFDYMLF